MVSEATKQRSCTQGRIQALSGVDSGDADKRPGSCRKGFWGKCGRMSAPRPNRRIAKVDSCVPAADSCAAAKPPHRRAREVQATRLTSAPSQC